MTTKEKLLALLEKQGSAFISGEEIAGKLYISRTAVWKAVEALRRDGYVIEAVQRRGYRLAGDADILSKEGVLSALKEEESMPPRMAEKLDLTCVRSITSTNTVLRKRAEEGAREGCVLAAEEQTAGKGRAGRSFYSPQGSGLYMSLLIRPKGISAERAARCTTMAAVAACEAIEEVTGRPAQIKWVNDIYMQGKKVAGILTEAAVDLESGNLGYAVLGIGFNVYPPREGFPDDLKERAGAILKSPVRGVKNRLAAAFTARFFSLFEAENSAQEGGGSPGYAAAYRQRCFVTGKRIDVLSGGEKTPALALGVDDECRLSVRYDDGRIETLSAGEVSIRI